MITNIVAFIVVLGILVLFHEFGHFIVAKLFNVGVEKFSIGFGPRLFGRKIGKTDYMVSAIPLGGYVKMTGEDPEKEVAYEDIPLSFAHKHVFKRILIVAAGPFFNFLLAVIIFAGIFYFSGIPVLRPVVGDINENGSAFNAGIEKGDSITSVNDINVRTWQDMADLIGESKGEEIRISAIRDGYPLSFTLKAEPQSVKNTFGEDITRYIIGITAGNIFDKKKPNPFKAITESVGYTINVAKLTVTGIGKLVSGALSAKEMGLGGPIMIAQIAGDQAKRGVLDLIFFIAILSINLAVLNLLPIPILDGGHLLIFSIEIIIRRPVDRKIKQNASKIGFCLLSMLTIYVFYSDIVRIFSE